MVCTSTTYKVPPVLKAIRPVAGGAGGTVAVSVGWAVSVGARVGTAVGRGVSAGTSVAVGEG